MDAPLDHTCAPLRFENSTEIGCIGGHGVPNYVKNGNPKLRFMEIYDSITKNWTLTNHAIPVLGWFQTFKD